MRKGSCLLIPIFFLDMLEAVEPPSSSPSTSETAHRAQQESGGDLPDLKWEEALCALSALSLTWVKLGDYVIVMNGEMDVVIGGEPHIALQLWFNMKSCQFLSRVWSQTVAYGKVANITQFMEACTNNFQGRPCLGYLLGEEEQLTDEFLFSQTPVPRMISRGCQKILNKETSANMTSCQECLKLGYPAVMRMKEEYVPHAPPTYLKKHAKNNADMNQESDLEDNSIKDYFVKTFNIESDIEQPPDSAVEKVLNLEQGMSIHEDVVDAEHNPISTVYKGQNSEEEYACENTKCEYVASSCSNLNRHCQHSLHYSSVLKQKSWSRVRKNEGEFVCESADCGYRSKWGKSLMEHCQRFSHDSSHLTPSQRQTVLHKITQASERCNFDDMKCDICGKLVRSANYAKHMLTLHGKKGKFYKQCDICKNKFSTTTFDRHAMKQHFYGRFVCVKCKFRSNLAKELINHMNEDHKEEHFVQCPSCHKEHAIKEIDSHYKICIRHTLKLKKGKVGVRMCDTCGKVYTGRSYEAHMKTHLRKKADDGEEIHDKSLYCYCEKCGKRFAHKRDLRDHVQSAHDKIEYTCPLCPMTFKTRVSLKGHNIIAHSTDKKYQCKYCGLRCVSTYRRKIHETVHEDPKFECKFCKKRLKCSEDLEAHERYHTGEKPFKCHICGNGYVKSNRLQQHLNGVHKITGPRGGKPGWRAKKKE